MFDSVWNNRSQNAIRRKEIQPVISSPHVLPLAGGTIAHNLTQKQSDCCRAARGLWRVAYVCKGL